MNIFDLAAKITLDSSDYEKGISKAGDQFSDLGSKVKSGLATIGKITAAGLAAAAGGAVAIVKSAVDEYADYEQLVGGVETLFGAGGASIEEYAEQHKKSVDSIRSEYNKLIKSQKTVLNNSAKAYRTAGLSANEYMDTVTSFSAALLQGLKNDTQAAAEYADKAVIDMADNANKMGTDIKSIQYAYQGFAKQNYTMLDNLKLGYGGTASEMARLVNESGVLAGKFEASADNINKVSFDKIIEAIHVVQGRIGITGTTAEEAASTIQGSVASMKSAWHNLLVGVSDDNQDFDRLMDEFVESVSTAAKNILPRIEKSLDGVGKLVDKLAPIISERLPGVTEKVLPSLISAASSLFAGLAKSLPSLVTTVLNEIPGILPELLDAVTGMVSSLGKAIKDSAPELIDSATDLVVKLIEFMTESLPDAIPQIVEFITGLAKQLTEPEMLDKLIIAALDLVMAIMEGILDAIPKLVEAVPQIIFNIVQALLDPEMLSKLGDAGWKLMWTLILIIPEFCVSLLSEFGKVWGTIFNALKDPSQRDKLKETGKQILFDIWDGIKSRFSWLYDKLVNSFKDMFGKLKNSFSWVTNLFGGGGNKNTSVSTSPSRRSSYNSQSRALRKAIRADAASYTMPYSANYNTNNTTFSGLSINIETNTQSTPESIAEAIAKRLQIMSDRGGAVYA